MHFRFDAIPLVLPSAKSTNIRVARAIDQAPTSPTKTMRRDVALDALRETIAELGQKMPETSTISPGSKTVTIDQWRERWAVRTGYKDSGADSIRTNFNKDKDALWKAGKIGISAPHVWSY